MKMSNDIVDPDRMKDKTYLSIFNWNIWTYETQNHIWYHVLCILLFSAFEISIDLLWMKSKISGETEFSGYWNQPYKLLELIT